MTEKEEEEEEKRRISRMTKKIGRISMVWKTTMGETAKLQTEIVERDLPSTAGVDVVFLDCPATMILGWKYTLKGRLYNHGNVEADVRKKKHFYFAADVFFVCCLSVWIIIFFFVDIFNFLFFLFF